MENDDFFTFLRAQRAANLMLLQIYQTMIEAIDQGEIAAVRSQLVKLSDRLRQEAS